MVEVEKTRKRKAKDRDGIYRRRGHWHFEYKDPQTGQWRSKTTGKTNYNDAKEFKKAFMESMKGQYNPSNDRLKFTHAADSYMAHRKVAAGEGSRSLEKERLRQLKRVLAQLAGPDLKLKDIGIELVRSYQQKRIAEGTSKGERHYDVGPRCVNMEGQLLRSILKHHGQWKLDGKYKPLPEPVSEAGRSLSPEEEVRLIDAAKSRPKWLVAYHATILQNETGMRGVEVRNLQLKRIDLMTGEIRLQKSKTKGGVRTIPLNQDALESAKELLMRAQKFGANQPDHYLIPALVPAVTDGKNGPVRIRRYDPSRPTTGWRTAWRTLTAAAGLRGLRGHDLRHNWVTSHAEIGTPQSVLEAQAGHLSKRMSDHYKHISEKAARKASDELTRVKATQRAEARAKLAQVAQGKRELDSLSAAIPASANQSAMLQ
jgi:integrase